VPQPACLTHLVEQHRPGRWQGGRLRHDTTALAIPVPIETPRHPSTRSADMAITPPPRRAWSGRICHARNERAPDHEDPEPRCSLVVITSPGV
jgi:hypothetical protein